VIATTETADVKKGLQRNEFKGEEAKFTNKTSKEFTGIILMNFELKKRKN
jgi:hypothetical protein